MLKSNYINGKNTSYFIIYTKNIINKNITSIKPIK